jgi:DcuC family C4-dicarboxylate transporter
MDLVQAYLPGALMILIFIVMMALMYARKISALLALPLMALLFALIGICRYGDFFHLLAHYVGWPAFVALLHWFAIGFAFAIVLLVLASFRVISKVYALVGGLVIVLFILIANAPALTPVLRFSVISSLIATFQLKEIVDVVFHEGGLYLHEAYTVALFGGMLAVLVRDKKIAETFIKYAAELAGDKPFTLAVVMMLVTFVLFTTLGGLGAVIMVGTIILPIMLSLGIPALVGAGVFLIGISAGGTFNPGNWALYRGALQVPIGEIQTFALIMTLLYLFAGVIFIFLNLRVFGKRRYWSMTPAASEAEAPARVRPIALLSPLAPLVLVFRLESFAHLFEYVQGKAAILDIVIRAFSRFATFWDNNIGGWSFIPAFMFGLVFCAITTWEKRDNVRIVTKAMIEGAESVMPAVLLMIGIGMLLQAVRHPDVSVHLRPIIEKVVPSTRLGYVLGFGLAAPLALYRGPLNLWGLGLGIGALFMEAGLATPLIMGIFMSVGAIQGVCDPTNTHNVWIANFINEDVVRLTKKLLLYIWLMAIVGLLMASYLFASGFAHTAAK